MAWYAPCSRKAALALVLALCLQMSAGAQAQDTAQPLLDPVVLAEALATHRTFTALSKELKDSDSLEAPFTLLQHYMFQASDAVSQERGLHGRVIFMMNSPSAQSGIEMFVYRSSADAARHLEYLQLTPESSSADAWHFKTANVTATNRASGHTMTGRCAYADMPSGTLPRQLRCAHHEVDSQIAVTTYSYGSEGLDFDAMTDLILRSGPVLGAARRVASRTEARLKAPVAEVEDRGELVAFLPPDDLPPLARALLNADFQGDLFQAVAARMEAAAKAGKSLEPFGPPKFSEYLAATESERAAGLLARVVVPMDMHAPQTGIELLVYNSTAEAVAHAEKTGTWPEDQQAETTFSITHLGNVEFDDGTGDEIPCTVPINPGGALRFRCVAWAENSRVLSVAFHTAQLDEKGEAAIHQAHYDAGAVVAFEGLAAAWKQEQNLVPDERLLVGTDCSAIVGPWRWFIGGIATFEHDGSGHWKANPDAEVGLSADWTCDFATGLFTVTWQQGLVDTLAVTADDKLSGENQHGVPVTAERHDPAQAAREAQAAAAVTVDPKLVGTWNLEIWIPTPQGPVPAVWHIRDDGTYEVEAAHLSHAGTMEAKDGQWKLESRTNDWKDGGRYEMEGWTAFITHGTLGPGRWHRKEPALKLDLVDMGTEVLPGGLPELVGGAGILARRWQADAHLVSLELDHEDNQKRKPVIESRFFSPASGGGLVITTSPGGSGFFEHRAVRWGESAIPDGFLDLPQAWATARQHGQPAPLGRADLRIYEPEGIGQVLAWSLSSQRGHSGINIDAATGEVLEGDLTGYVAAYNAQWQQAVAGLRKLFARPAPRPSYDFGWSSTCCDSGSSSSYDDDGGSSSSSSGTGAQNAWGAGDMQAYDRIMSGTATWEDKSRYGY